jgi:CDP-4-dehydro-6-deoxyglucose reductase
LLSAAIAATMHLVFTVTLKSTGRQFPVAAGETVLEAAQRAGVALPYSCRAGD